MLDGELKKEIESLGAASRITGGIFDVERMTSLVERIEHESQDPAFWNDNRAAKKKQTELSTAKDDLATYRSLEKGLGI